MTTETSVDREQLAAALEREAALLRRPEFDVTTARFVIEDEPQYSSRSVSIRIDWDSGGPAMHVDTREDYHGRETDRSYDSVWVNGRWAHAYESAHHPEGDIWYLRVHQRDDSTHLGERWFGGCVLTSPAGGFLRMSRDEAISAADLWAHHGELPQNASTR